MTLTLRRPDVAEPTTSPVSYGWAPRGALIVGGALATLLLIHVGFAAVDLQPPALIRGILLFAGVLLLPGIPVVVALRIPGRALAAALTFAISLSTNVLVTQTSIVIERWSPLWTQTLIMGVSLIACVAAWRWVPGSTRIPGWQLSAEYWTRRRYLSLGGLAAAIGCFALGATQLDVLAVGRIGVLGELTLWNYLGLALLAAVVVSALSSRRVDTLVLSVTTATVVLYNVMLVGLATSETSVPTSFVHRGFIDAIAALHHLPDQIDARFSWAGFFSMSAHLESVGALEGNTAVLLWAPFITGIAMSFGLYTIAIVITGRARLAWLSVLLYHGFNWYQQDYFAPQALASIGYVAIIGTLLWQLRAAPLPASGTGASRLVTIMRRTPGRVPGFGAGRTLAVEVVLLVIITANTVAHQMTPMLTVLALFAFTITGTTRYRTLWLAAGFIFAAWFSYGATDFWLGHLPSLVEEIGQVGNSVGAGIGDRLSGEPLYKQMQYLRMAASGSLALLGFAGWLIWRRRRAWLVAGMLCAAPFVLVFLQSYGGEMIIRAFLLASPTLAPFAALALAAGYAWLRKQVPSPTRAVSVLALVLAGALVAGLGVLETTNRGLNTAFEASTVDEVRVSEAFIDQIPPDSVVMSFSHAPHTVGVRRTIDPDGPRFAFIDSLECVEQLAQCTINRTPDYVYITNQGIQQLVLQYGRSEDEITSEIAKLASSEHFEPMVVTPSIEILRATAAPQLNFAAVTSGSQEG